VRLSDLGVGRGLCFVEISEVSGLRIHHLLIPSLIKKKESERTRQ
jgi:hypothetical protein